MRSNKELAVFIKAIAKEKNITVKSILEQSNINKNFIYDLEHRDNVTPSLSTLKKIADYLGITVDYLLNTNTPPRKKGVKIPVYGTVPAGIPMEAIQDIIDYEEIDEDMARKGDYFALQIKGHSMEPRIWDGDIVIVRCQPDADSGDIVIAMVNGEDATCKKLRKMDKEGIVLIPLNSTYEPMYFTNDEIEELPVHILGKVVQVRGNL